MNRTVRLLALSRNRQNKVRSFFITLTVCFTTLLLTSVFSIGYGALDFERKNAETLYGEYYGSLSHLSAEEAEIVAERGEVAESGLSAYAGEAQTDEKLSLDLIWMDETCRRLCGSSSRLSSGRYPASSNEIAAQPGFFRAVGAESIRPGDTVTLMVRSDLESFYEPVKFTVSGILEENSDKRTVRGYTAFVSEEFLKNFQNDGNLQYTIYFTIHNTVKMDNYNYMDVLKKLVSGWGIHPDKLTVNSAYLRFSLDPGLEILAACFLIAAVIILFSVLVIYNIFQVGVAQSIREYGRIKAVGATRGQLRRIIFWEGMVLCILGIIPGLAAGCLVSCIILPWLTKLPDTGTELVQVIPIYPWVLLLAALLALGTSVLGVMRPMRTVGKISPIEAIRYQNGNFSAEKQGVRKGHKTMSVWNLTLSNIAANKRRTAATILTMGLSCILFVTLSAYVGNIDAEYEARRDVRHGQFVLSLDYALSDSAYPENNLDCVLSEKLLGSGMVERIRQIPGVTSVTSQLWLAGRNKGKLESVSVLSQEEFERYAAEDSYQGEQDYDKISHSDGIIYGRSYFMEENGYALGDEIDLTLTDGEQESSFTGSLSGAVLLGDTTWMISEDTWRSLALSGESNGLLWIDCAPEYASEVESALQEIASESAHLSLNSYADALDLANASTAMLTVLIYSVLGLLGIIGFFNMANTLIISIITRRREFGILQAAGMTRRQMNISLQLEGILFTAGTCLIALLAGIPAGYALFLYGKSKAQYGLNEFHLPWLEIVLFLAAVFLLQFVLSWVLSRNLKKESVIERIGGQE